MWPKIVFSIVLNKDRKSQKLHTWVKLWILWLNEYFAFGKIENWFDVENITHYCKVVSYKAKGRI